MYVIDTHMHTLASGHAFNTFNEMMHEAVARDMKIVCITEHGPAMPGAAHEFYYTNMRVIEKEFFHFRDIPGHETRLIKGLEANIIDYNGNTDYDTLQDKIADLKYIIASFHPSCCIESGDERQNTSAYLGAIRKPYTMAVGHIDDGRVPCDYEAVVNCAKQNNVLVELNNSSMNPKSFRQNSVENALEYLQLCKEKEAMIVLGSDAHYQDSIGDFSNLYPILKKVNFPEELIINSDADKFMKWFDEKYQNRLRKKGLL